MVCDRYAYSPVNDVDTEEMEQMPSEAFGLLVYHLERFHLLHVAVLVCLEGMKLRSMKSEEEKDQRRPNSAVSSNAWDWKTVILGK